MIQIAPSILASDFSKMGEELRKIDRAGADWVHVDVMDGMFVPNITFGQAVIGSYRKHTDLPFDVHLMIVDPIRYIKDFAEAGSDYITFHVEAVKGEKEVRETIQAIRECGKKVGLSIKPGTPASALTPYLNLIDLVLIMTVEPGFGNQKLIPECLEKVAQVRADAKAQGVELLISVDGGVNPSTIQQVWDSGVDVAVAGSAVFKAEDTAEMIRSFQGN